MFNRNTIFQEQEDIAVMKMSFKNIPLDELALGTDRFSGCLRTKAFTCKPVSLCLFHSPYSQHYSLTFLYLKWLLVSQSPSSHICLCFNVTCMWSRGVTCKEQVENMFVLFFKAIFMEILRVHVEMFVGAAYGHRLSKNGL